jgi:hypothetical protein
VPRPLQIDPSINREGIKSAPNGYDEEAGRILPSPGG